MCGCMGYLVRLGRGKEFPTPRLSCALCLSPSDTGWQMPGVFFSPARSRQVCPVVGRGHQSPGERARDALALLLPPASRGEKGTSCSGAGFCAVRIETSSSWIFPPLAHSGQPGVMAPGAVPTKGFFESHRLPTGLKHTDTTVPCSSLLLVA